MMRRRNLYGGYNLPGLLDSHSGAILAYSLRLLNSTYTGPCIRVLRETDNAQLDIGFLNGLINTTQLLSFIGADNGYISKWYDQSGNSNDAVQSVVSNMPIISSAGVIYTENSKPSISFNGPRGLNFTPVNGQYVSIFTVINNYLTAGGWGGYFRMGSSGNYGFCIFSRNTTQSWDNFFRTYNANEFEISTSGRARGVVKVTPTGLYLDTWIYSGATALYENGISTAMMASDTIWGSQTTGQIGSLGWSDNSLAACNFSISEMIVFANDKTAEQAEINTNIFTNYSI